MTNKYQLFDNLKKEFFLLWSSHKNLNEFVKLPRNLKYNSIPNNKIESVKILESWEENDSSIKSIHKSIKQVSPYANWRQTYEEKDIGKTF